MATNGREQILQAAIQAFSARGYVATTTAGVARAAGVTQPLIHHHFGSKKGLFDATVDALFEPVVALLREHVERARQDAQADILRGLVAALTRATAAQPALARLIVIDGGEPGPGHDAIWRRWGQALNEVLWPLIDLAVARGQVPDVPRWMLVSVIYGACSRPWLEAATVQERHGVDPMDPAAVDAYADFVTEVMAAGLEQVARRLSP